MKADVRGLKFMSKRIVKFKTFDYLRLSMCLHFLIFRQSSFEISKAKKNIADLRTVSINKQFI